jgi:hypothetical protein
MTRNQIGDYGEFNARKQLSRYGVIARRSTAKNGDLITSNGVKIEVKTATMNSKGQFKFCLYKRNKTDYRYSDYVLLQCITDCTIEYYLIPTKNLKQKHICIGKNSKKYQSYRKTVKGVANELQWLCT